MEIATDTDFIEFADYLRREFGEDKLSKMLTCIFTANSCLFVIATNDLAAYEISKASSGFTGSAVLLRIYYLNRQKLTRIYSEHVTGVPTEE